LIGAVLGITVGFALRRPLIGMFFGAGINTGSSLQICNSYLKSINYNGGDIKRINKK